MRQGSGTTVRWSATSSLHTFYYAERLEDGTVLRIGKDSENISHMLKRTGAIVLVVSLFVVLFCGMLSRCLTKKLLSPIEKLASNPDGPARGLFIRKLSLLSKGSRSSTLIYWTMCGCGRNLPRMCPMS